MSELRELYQEVILDHSKRPRNFRLLDAPTRQARGHNPLCGDNIAVFVVLEGDVIRDVAFQGSGCAICTSSASMMTESVKGRRESEAEELFRRFHDMATSAEAPRELGKLAVFAGVREFPVRVKCATLPWHTLHAALAEATEPVSTE